MSGVLRNVLVAGLLAIIGWTAAASPATANSKYAAYVVHAHSGDVLYSRYANHRRYPASLTKMMTLYLVFEELEAGRLTMNSKLKVSKRAAGQPPSKLGLKTGSTITVSAAIDALIVKSANDVAVVVAEHISGSEWRFAQKMTAKARTLGMSRTTFRNASGLPNSKQITTAKDMALLGRRVNQDFPQYFGRFKTKSFTWNGKTYRTHNSLVKDYKGADGIKTGYTRRSGFNLVTTVTRDGQRLIGVVLGGRSGRTRDKHMRDILSKSFARIKSKPSLIAALHRKKPAPRLKPTLVAALNTKTTVPTINDNDLLRREILAAAEGISATSSAAPNANSANTDDNLGALIAVASTRGGIKNVPTNSITMSANQNADDLNEYQRVRLAALLAKEGEISQGDINFDEPADWAVQIGAYSSKDLAYRKLDEAVKKLMHFSGARAISPSNRNQAGKRLYRARIINLSAADAKSICSTLKAVKHGCFVIPGKIDVSAN